MTAHYANFDGILDDSHRKQSGPVTWSPLTTLLLTPLMRRKPTVPDLWDTIMARGADWPLPALSRTRESISGDLRGKGVEPDYRVTCDTESGNQLRVQRDTVGIIDPLEFASVSGIEPIPDPHWLKAIELLSRTAPEE